MVEYEDLVVPRGAEFFRVNGFSIATISPDLMTHRLGKQIYNTELAFARRMVGDDIKRRAAHTIFYGIDAFNKDEKPYSRWHLGIKNGKVVVVAMERIGREHHRRRFHCEGEKENVREFLPTLPSLLGEPEEIALVLNASDFTPEEAADIYRDRYELDPKGIQRYIRAYVDYDIFKDIVIPSVSANVEIRRLNYFKITRSRHSDQILQSIRDFYRAIQGDNFSFKSRSMRTPGAYYDAQDQFSKTRLGIGGIIAQAIANVDNNDTIPLSMGGDLAVAEEARDMGLGLALRWITYASVFRNHDYRDGIITSYFTEDNVASQKIIFDHLKGIEVSRSLWVVLKTKPKLAQGSK
ncbi:hypothetical protein HY041_02370 [Candidatus Roizmanbacteria bacterium]|nr:hypothetical protein [Candidatus Roizmanbacteria bacterium]